MVLPTSRSRLSQNPGHGYFSAGGWLREISLAATENRLSSFFNFLSSMTVSRSHQASAALGEISKRKGAHNVGLSDETLSDT